MSILIFENHFTSHNVLMTVLNKQAHGAEDWKGCTTLVQTFKIAIFDFIPKLCAYD